MTEKNFFVESAIPTDLRYDTRAIPFQSQNSWDDDLIHTKFCRVEETCVACVNYKFKINVSPL